MKSSVENSRSSDLKMVNVCTYLSLALPLFSIFLLPLFKLFPMIITMIYLYALLLLLLLIVYYMHYYFFFLHLIVYLTLDNAIIFLIFIFAFGNKQKKKNTFTHTDTYSPPFNWEGWSQLTLLLYQSAGTTYFILYLVLELDLFSVSLVLVVCCLFMYGLLNVIASRNIKVRSLFYLCTNILIDFCCF